MSGRDVDVVDGDLLKPLVVLSLPIVLSQLLQVGYNLADTFWVGRLGQEAVSALSYSWPLVFLMISVAGGFTVAGTIHWFSRASRTEAVAITASFGTLLASSILTV